MTNSDNSAIARLEVRVQHLTDNAKKLEATLERVETQQGQILNTLAQSKGGFMVMKWLGFGSLGALLGTAAVFWQWLKGGH